MELLRKVTQRPGGQPYSLALILEYHHSLVQQADVGAAMVLDREALTIRNQILLTIEPEAFFIKLCPIPGPEHHWQGTQHHRQYKDAEHGHVPSGGYRPQLQANLDTIDQPERYNERRYGKDKQRAKVGLTHRQTPAKIGVVHFVQNYTSPYKYSSSKNCVLLLCLPLQLGFAKCCTLLYVAFFFRKT